MIEAPKKFLCTVDHSVLSTFVRQAGESAFRESQIRDWVFGKRVLDPVRMHNLPAALKEAIATFFFCPSSTVIEENAAADGTIKLLLRLFDGQTIEMVIIPSAERRTFCLSTQAGCPVGCRFCASGATGLARNLHAGEIVEQLYHGCARIGEKMPDNIVFMGIGEGLLNFRNLAESIAVICGTERLGMAARRLTVSTSGYVPGILKLAELDREINLAISLHAPDDVMRAQLIPDKLRYPISEILAAARFYREKTGRMVTFEYTLIAGVNASRQAAEKLADIAREFRAKVNLIPCNSTDAKYQAPPSDDIKRFEQILLQRGVQVTCRVKKGNAVNAACGQLRMRSLTQ